MLDLCSLEFLKRARTNISSQLYIQLLEIVGFCESRYLSLKYLKDNMKNVKLDPSVLGWCCFEKSVPSLAIPKDVLNLIALMLVLWFLYYGLPVRP